MNRILNKINELSCWVLGHDPRGPVRYNPTLYRCDKCNKLIIFNRGWHIYHE